tara:strand:+ start:1695 stop:1874 length:180 start_codon:yes stop_codon:yes gene_type:complete
MKEHDTPQDKGWEDTELSERMHHPVADELTKPRVSFMHCFVCGSVHTNPANRLRCIEGQ